jgi:hypothetical protein
MVNNQIFINIRVNCPNNKKLSEKDLKRIYAKTGGITNDNNECILWNGYITHNKIDYINFYFNGRKCALHRLLYINFKGHINDNDYLEYICNNKGKCCNINHISKKKIKKKININLNVVYFD